MMIINLACRSILQKVLSTRTHGHGAHFKVAVVATMNEKEHVVVHALLTFLETIDEILVVAASPVWHASTTAF